MAKTTILSVSFDHGRLDYRNEILRREGYEVLSSSDVSHALNLVDGADLMIIGDSIPDKDKETLISGMKKKKTIPYLILLGTYSSGLRADATVHVLDGPVVLLRELRHMLEKGKATEVPGAK